MAALIAHVALDLADRGQLPASSFLLASTSASTSTKVGLPFVPRESIARDREAHAAKARSSSRLARCSWYAPSKRWGRCWLPIEFAVQELVES